MLYPRLHMIMPMNGTHLAPGRGYNRAVVSLLCRLGGQRRTLRAGYCRRSPRISWLTSGKLWNFLQLCHRGNHYGLNFGKRTSFSRSKLRCPWANGMRSGNRILRPKKLRWSSASGGKSGKRTTFRSLITLFSRMTRLIARKRRRITLRLRHGGYLGRTARVRSILFYWMRRRVGGIFRS